MLYKYYVTPSPNGLEGPVQSVTTVYISVTKALEYLNTKTSIQRSQLYIRRVGRDGKDAGVEMTPEQASKELEKVHL